MRVGTWNLEGKWSNEHLSLLLGLDCDVLLLTEVSEMVAAPGHLLHLGEANMASRRRWAGVMVRGDDLQPMRDPHPASAMAISRGFTFCSSILPWSGSGGKSPWIGDNHLERTADAVAALLTSLPRTDLVWGGDWNHAMSGREWCGSKAGRDHIHRALHELKLRVPTADLAHRNPELLAIDHIAVPVDSTVVGTGRVDASGPPPLSDHDAYVVELADR